MVCQATAFFSIPPTNARLVCPRFERLKLKSPRWALAMLISPRPIPYGRRHLVCLEDGAKMVYAYGACGWYWFMAEWSVRECDVCRRRMTGAHRHKAPCPGSHTTLIEDHERAVR